MSLGEHFRKKRDEAPFLIFLSFLISFAIGRSWRFFGVEGPPLKTQTYTLHHLYYGVILLIIAGWIAINYRDRDLTRVNSVIYGAGLGLFFDEIGYLLTHFENYWDEITYSVVLLVSLVLLNIIYFRDFWNSVGSQLHTFAEKNRVKYGPLSLLGTIDIIDKAEKKMPKEGQIAKTSIGITFIVGGILVLEYPSFVEYWIAGAFILSGIVYIIKSIRV